MENSIVFIILSVLAGIAQVVGTIWAIATTPGGPALRIYVPLITISTFLIVGILGFYTWEQWQNKPPTVVITAPTPSDSQDSNKITIDTEVTPRKDGVFVWNYVNTNDTFEFYKANLSTDKNTFSSPSITTSETATITVGAVVVDQFSNLLLSNDLNRSKNCRSTQQDLNKKTCGTTFLPNYIAKSDEVSYISGKAR